MEDKKSIINPELHNLVNKNKKMKFDKEFKPYKKPFLGRILDRFGNFCELFSEKVNKRPIFFILSLGQLLLLTLYFYKSCQGIEIPQLKWGITSFFFGFFTYFTFFSKR